MATLNRILIVVITLLAITAAVLSYFLFERRNEFRDRASELAENVSQIVRHLDNESETRLGRDITFSAKDPEQKLPESGTLSWQSYHDDPAAFEQRLEEAAGLAETVNAQRNYLAEQLGEVGFDIGMPVEELSVEALKNAADSARYKESADKVARLAEAVGERDDDLIRTITNAAKVIEAPVEEEQLRDREMTTNEAGEDTLGGFTHEMALDTFTSAVTGLNTRATDYANALANAVRRVSAHDWDTSPEALQSKDEYNQALTAMMNDFEEVNERLVEADQLEVRLDEVTQDLEETTAELNRVSERRDELQARVNELELKLAQRPDQPGDGDQRAAQPGDFEIPKDLTGRVVMVNEEWDFVILNLGRDEIRRGVHLLVARDDQFVARLVVTNVTRKVSVAEIIPDTRQVPVQVDDRVIVPQSM